LKGNGNYKEYGGMTILRAICSLEKDNAKLEIITSLR
jgi:hypothetical protein